MAPGFIHYHCLVFTHKKKLIKKKQEYNDTICEVYIERNEEVNTLSFKLSWTMPWKTASIII